MTNTHENRPRIVQDAIRGLERERTSAEAFMDFHETDTEGWCSWLDQKVRINNIIFMVEDGEVTLRYDSWGHITIDRGGRFLYAV